MIPELEHLNQLPSCGQHNELFSRTHFIVLWILHAVQVFLELQPPRLFVAAMHVTYLPRVFCGEYWIIIPMLPLPRAVTASSG